jgi:hypothetical protein
MMKNLSLKNITSSKKDLDFSGKVYDLKRSKKIRNINILTNLIFIFFKKIEESVKFNEKYYFLIFIKRKSK